MFQSHRARSLRPIHPSSRRGRSDRRRCSTQRRCSWALHALRCNCLRNCRRNLASSSNRPARVRCMRHPMQRCSRFHQSSKRPRSMFRRCSPRWHVFQSNHQSKDMANLGEARSAVQRSRRNSHPIAQYSTLDRVCRRCCNRWGHRNQAMCAERRTCRCQGNLRRSSRCLARCRRSLRPNRVGSRWVRLRKQRCSRTHQRSQIQDGQGTGRRGWGNSVVDRRNSSRSLHRFHPTRASSRLDRDCR